MTRQIKTIEEYHEYYKQSVEDPEGFWRTEANDFEWKKPFGSVLQWNFDKPDVRWFVNGKLNITENCLDRHIEHRGDQTAIIWEPNDPNGESLHISYKELLSRVNKCANALKSLGIQKGDYDYYRMRRI